MSVQASSHVINHSKHKGGELLCLLMIANHAHSDGTNAFPKVTTLAKECRMSERQIRRIIDRLEASGELLVERGIGRGNVHYFTVVMDEPVPMIAPKEKRTKCPKPDAPPPDTKADKMSEKSGQNVTAKADISDAPLPYMEPSLEPSLNRESGEPLALNFESSFPKQSSPVPSELAVIAKPMEPVKPTAEVSPAPVNPAPPKPAPSKPPAVKKQFTPPTLEEAQNFFATLARPDLAPAFHDHYTAVGWVYGKARTPVKDWQAAARQWVRREAQFAQSFTVHKGVPTHVPSAKSVTANSPQLSIHEWRRQNGIAGPNPSGPQSAPLASPGASVPSAASSGPAACRPASA